MFRAILGVLGLMVIVAVTVPAKQPEPHALFISPEMLDQLEMIAETSRVESARCIHGDTQGDTTYLDASFDTPWLQSEATDTGLMFHSILCPRGTVAWWHTHLWRVVKEAARKRGVSPEYYCQPSEYDGYGKPFPLSLISIKRGMTCIYFQHSDGTFSRVPFER